MGDEYDSSVDASDVDVSSDTSSDYSDDTTSDNPDVSDDITEDTYTDDYTETTDDISDDILEDTSSEEYIDTEDTIPKDVEEDTDSDFESYDDSNTAEVEDIAEDTYSDEEYVDESSEVDDIAEDVNEDSTAEESVEEVADIPEDTEANENVGDETDESADAETEETDDIVDGITEETTDTEIDVTDENANSGAETVDENNAEITDNNKGAISDLSAEEAARKISEYYGEHDYSPGDYETYSQDPEWRNLMRTAYPDTELPPLSMSQEEASRQISEFYGKHDYSPGDYDTYSQDPEWRELTQIAYPETVLPPLEKNDVETEIVYKTTENQIGFKDEEKTGSNDRVYENTNENKPLREKTIKPNIWQKASIVTGMGVALKAYDSDFETIDGFMIDKLGKTVMGVSRTITHTPSDLKIQNDKTVSAMAHMYDKKIAMENPEKVINRSPSPVSQDLIDKNTLVVNMEDDYSSSKYSMDKVIAKNDIQSQAPSMGEALRDEDLFNKNQPGNYTYTKIGKAKQAYGHLKITDEGIRNNYAQRNVGGKARLPDDDGGHLIGTRFGGAPDDRNIEAQNYNLNRSSYKAKENEWEEALKHGDKVFVNVETPHDTKSDRPDAYMGYTIIEHPDGRREWDAFSYTNASRKEQEQWEMEAAEYDDSDEYENPMKEIYKKNNYGNK